MQDRNPGRADPRAVFAAKMARNGIDSADTPPLSEAERKTKKIAKKEAKLARRAAAAEAAAAGSDDDEEETAPVKEKKRKAAAVEEDAEVPATVEGKKEKKTKKSKKADDSVTPSTSSTPVPVASTSTAPASSADVAAFLKENRVSHEPESAATSFPPVLSFAALPLEEGIRRGLAAYTKPTPIQSASFPVMMGGRDVIGIAETGYVLSSFPPCAQLTPLVATDPARRSPLESQQSSTSSPSLGPKRVAAPSQSSSSLLRANSPCRRTPTSRPSRRPSLA